uniref:Uncharacterized protein n=1 Tax=Arundo donax TaxID=35708 RepID=A0A0A9EAP6_ARUDO
MRFLVASEALKGASTTLFPLVATESSGEGKWYPFPCFSFLQCRWISG